jgi:hypothetical protein
MWLERLHCWKVWLRPITGSMVKLCRSRCFSPENGGGQRCKGPKVPSTSNKIHTLGLEGSVLGMFGLKVGIRSFYCDKLRDCAPVATD